MLMSGKDGTGAVGARRFAERLRGRAPEVQVELWDERLTTVQAEKLLISDNVKRRNRKRVIDGVAATIILQNYLDARSTGIESGR